MQEIPQATTLTAATKAKNPATADSSNATLNSTQRFKHDLIKANKSAADTSLETKHVETPDPLSTAPTNPTVTAYPPHMSPPQVQTTNSPVSTKSKHKGKEKEK